MKIFALLVLFALVAACDDADPTLPVDSRGPIVIAGAVRTGSNALARTQVFVQVREAGCGGETLDSAFVPVTGGFRIERNARMLPEIVCVIMTANPAPSPASQEFRNARIIRDSINVHRRDTTFIDATIAYNFGLVSAATSTWGDVNALLPDLSLEVITPSQTVKVGGSLSDPYTYVRVAAGDSVRLKAVYQSSSAFAELSYSWRVNPDVMAGFTAVVADTTVPTGCFLCAYQQRLAAVPVRLVTGAPTGDTLSLMLSTLSPLSEYMIQ